MDISGRLRALAGEGNAPLRNTDGQRSYRAWAVALLSIVLRVRPTHLGAGFASSTVYAQTDTRQACIAAVGGVSHACVWSGTAAWFVDLNPVGAVRSVAYSASGPFQAGYITTALNDSPARASLWAGVASSWLDLSELLPSGRFTDSVALGVWTDGVTIRVTGSASDALLGHVVAIL